ncbi:MAG: 1-acyl-sn-glycerol-3-phosphate acyltransferase [Lachnospiraceae bacterium]|nr:1-acyl-sn-glycerol-3-phosphate acyltransferase [Lachnospiraceae bacterium]
MIILKNFFRLLRIIPAMRRLADAKPFDEKKAYDYLRKVVRIMNRTGRIRTTVFGEEQLPKEGGYILYSNHQGKYDGYAIVSGHESSCSVVMDRKRSIFPFIREVIDLVKGKRMELDDVRQSLKIINEVADEVAGGRRFLIFPEGGYDKKKKNTLWEFKPGCFKASLKSRTPIVPVVIVDTYRAFDISYPGPVRTQVHFLEPIPYEDFKGMKTGEIAQMVHDRIQEKLNEIMD